MNLSKSPVHFYSDVGEGDHALLAKSLGMPLSNGKEKYLGLLHLIVRSKKDTFAFQWDRVSKKTRELKEKFLSQGGKEVLIKVVLQSIPNYVMSTFFITKIPL